MVALPYSREQRPIVPALELFMHSTIVIVAPLVMTLARGVVYIVVDDILHYIHSG